MNKYDVCVIGGGPAGYAAAFRALDYGRSVVLIERDRLGGAGLYNGALASKTLWHLAQDYRHVRLGGRGYHVEGSRLDWKEIIAAQAEAVSERNAQLECQVEAYSRALGPERFRLVKGFGRIETPNEVAVDTTEGITLRFEAENLVLATGSRPRKIDSLPIDEKIVLTSDALMNLEKLPESLVIVGAGVIGCEYASIFAMFGQTKVHLIDKADRILPYEDEDVAEVVASNLEGWGVVVHRQAELNRLWVENGRVRFEICYNGDRCEIHEAEKALVSIGRVPNVEGLGCETVSLALNNRGYFIVDDCRTNIPNIFAVGDLTADICLVNVAENEGRHVMDKLYGGDTHELSYNNISTLMFLDPEVASVGMNEQQAQAAGVPYRVACLDYGYIPRAIAMRCSSGFIKILVSDDEEMKVLGMRVVGPHSSSTIQSISLLISLNRSIRDIAELVHPHPSIAEGVLECARMLLGKSILKPGCFRSGLRCSTWRSGEYVETGLPETVRAGM